jgi:hypothetical protein
VTTEKPTEANKRRTLWSVAAIILLGAGGAFAILKLLPETFLNTPYIVIVLLVAGFVSVTLLLYLGTIILRTAGLSAKGEALGMPEGSIRALIAMSLILIFAIIGVTVLYSGLGGDTIVSKGITAGDLDRLENVQIVGITVVQPAASPNPERFDVTARAELSQAGHDFGLQLLSTVSTLVVAVAGFYFGSRSVAQATKTTNEAAAAVLAATRSANAAAAGAPGQTVETTTIETTTSDTSGSNTDGQTIDVDTFDTTATGDEGGTDATTMDTTETIDANATGGQTEAIDEAGGQTEATDMVDEEPGATDEAGGDQGEGTDGGDIGPVGAAPPRKKR